MKDLRIGIGVTLLMGGGLAALTVSGFAGLSPVVPLLLLALIVGPTAWVLFLSRNAAALVRCLQGVGASSLALLAFLAASSGRSDEIEIPVGLMASALMLLPTLLVWPFAVHQRNLDEVEEEAAAEQRHAELLAALRARPASRGGFTTLLERLRGGGRQHGAPQSLEKGSGAFERASRAASG